MAAENDHDVDDFEDCFDCGATVSVHGTATYVVGDGTVLCIDCAMKRGGIYDELRDQWTQQPSVADLPDERRPHG